LTIPDAMGLGLHFVEGEGPKFERPLRDEAAILALAAPDPMRELAYVSDAVREIRNALKGRVPLIGFSGSPFTLACYMIEGGASSDFRTLKTMLYQRPDLLHRVLETNAIAVTDYLNAQVESGAQALMIFDTWGGTLTAHGYQEFSLAYIKKIIAGLKRESDGRRVPIIVFTKGGGLWLEAIAECGCDAVGLDWSTDIAKAKQRVGQYVALQGNLDPMVLLSNAQSVEGEAKRVLNAWGEAPGHVFNLGHGISQFTPPENVAALVETVHAESRRKTT
jgi:uroporphyrinogen decarboxylase